MMMMMMMMMPLLVDGVSDGNVHANRAEAQLVMLPLLQLNYWIIMKMGLLMTQLLGRSCHLSMLLCQFLTLSQVRLSNFLNFIVCLSCIEIEEYT